MFLCITNPFAVGLNPLDLHALSMPPAFILSQDQTLKMETSLPKQRCPDVNSDGKPSVIHKVLNRLLYTLNLSVELGLTTKICDLLIGFFTC
jgi:ABC-type microcin C transport system permease subunit YejE